MNVLSNIDMNLLKVLHVLIEERSVTGAGHKLGRSQPAMSNALNRLRHLLEDDLFVRSPDGLLLTPRAEKIRAPLAKIMELADFCLAENKPFDPTTEENEFRIAMPNRLSLPVLPDLMDHLKKSAPNMPLHISNADREPAINLVETNQIEMALGMFDQLPAALRSEQLFTEEFVMLCRRGHPILKSKSFTIDTLLSYPHLMVSSTGERSGIFDEVLAAYERKRDIAVSISNFSTAPYLLEKGDMLGVFLQRVSHFFKKSHDLVVRPIPLKLNKLNTHLIWHSRNEQDPRYQWLRAQIRETCERLS